MNRKRKRKGEMMTSSKKEVDIKKLDRGRVMFTDEELDEIYEEVFGLVNELQMLGENAKVEISARLMSYLIGHMWREADAMREYVAHIEKIEKYLRSRDPLF
jgi:hypothetical protein